MRNNYYFAIFLCAVFSFNINANAENLNRKKRSVTWNAQNSKYQEITSNENMICGIKETTSELFCYNLYKNKDRLPPNEIQIPGQYSKISLSEKRLCALGKTDGKIYCWANKLTGRFYLNSQTISYSTEKSSNINFVSLAQGAEDTFALDNEGKLWSTKYDSILNSKGIYYKIKLLSSSEEHNTYFELNRNTMGDKFIALTANDNFFCVINEIHKDIRCYGKNSYGQVLRFDKFIDTSEYKALAAGREHVCAITAEQKIECWGSNQFGQLGVDPKETFFSTLPISVQGQNKEEFEKLRFKSINATATGTCALTEEGKAYCFGDNTFGQLGEKEGAGPDSIQVINGQNYQIQFYPKEPLPNFKGTFLQLTGNSRVTCGITQDKNLLCWGFLEKNSYKSIHVGWENACGISESGSSFFCFGSENGLTTSLANPWNSPILIPWASTDKFVQVSIGRYQSCAITAEEKQNTYCWSNANTSNLKMDVYPKKLLSLEEKISKIVVGTNHICAIRAKDGAILCSGENGEGQLGNNTKISTNKFFEFVEVVKVNAQNNDCSSKNCDSQFEIFTDIALSNNSTCAITNNNDVYCFGSNKLGELGLNNSFPYNKFTPQKLKNLKLKRISAGSNHYCGITTSLNGEDKVVCWGNNLDGQTGQNNNIHKKIVKPILLSVIDKVQSISLKNDTSCFLNTKQEAFCFGSNIFGIIKERLNTDPAYIPVHVQTDKKFKDLSVGNKEACGISDIDSTVFCFGRNN